jgi:hypothetical protein
MNLLLNMNDFHPATFILITGSVGIGITSPAQQLSIIGGNTLSGSFSTGYYIGISSGSVVPKESFAIGTDASYTYLQSFSSKPLVLNSVGNNIILGGVGSGVNVGIATTSPVSLLTVATGNVTNAGQWNSSAIALYNPTNVGAYSQISFGYTTSTTNASAYIGYISTNQASNGFGDLVFGTRNVSTDTQPTERMRITSTGTASFSGNVSILSAAYDSAAEGLKLGYDASYYNAVAATFSSAAANNKMTFVVNSGTGTRGNVMTLLGSGNVGIGTTSPVDYTGYRSLHIMGASSTSSAILYLTNSTSTIRGLFFAEGTANRVTIGSQSTHDFTFLTNDTERMRITSAGYIGIGTANPARIIHTSGSAAGAEWILEDSAGTSGTNKFNVLVDSGKTQFRAMNATNSGGTVWMSVTNSTGNIGIGTTSPGALLHIYDGASGSSKTYTKYSCNDGGDIRVGKADGVNNNAIFGAWSNNDVVLYSNSAEAMRITSTGLIYLGSSANTVNGLAILYYGGGFANQTTLDANTRFQGPNNGVAAAKCYAWNTYSDQRIKKDVTTLSYGLNEILQLNPVSYKQYDSEVIDGEIVLKETYKNTIGLIAQQVNPLIKEAVTEGNDTELFGLDYDKIVPVLVKAIQELSAKNDALQTQINELKNN